MTDEIEIRKPINIELAAKAARYGMKIPEIADICGVSHDTLHRRMKTDKALSEAIKTAKATANMRIADALVERACDKDTNAAIFWLCNRDPERWKRNRDKPEQHYIIKEAVDLVGSDK